jgi:hypothetical protein
MEGSVSEGVGPIIYMGRLLRARGGRRERVEK